MNFQVFDWAAPAQGLLDGPVVRVDRVGRLLLNAQAAEFLIVRGLAVLNEVTMMFAAAERTAAVQPLPADTDVPQSQRRPLKRMRSQQWPWSVDARRFVEHYRFAVGEYPARLVPGPGPRMLTFAAGRPAAPAERVLSCDVLPERDKGWRSTPVGG